MQFDSRQQTRVNNYKCTTVVVDEIKRLLFTGSKKAEKIDKYSMQKNTKMSLVRVLCSKGEKILVNNPAKILQARNVYFNIFFAKLSWNFEIKFSVLEKCTEAEFLNVIGTKMLRVFLLAFHSIITLYSETSSLRTL
jgi:hypothetical protein